MGCQESSICIARQRSAFGLASSAATDNLLKSSGPVFLVFDDNYLVAIAIDRNIVFISLFHVFDAILFHRLNFETSHINENYSL